MYADSQQTSDAEEQRGEATVSPRRNDQAQEAESQQYEADDDNLHRDEIVERCSCGSSEGVTNVEQPVPESADDLG